MHKFGEASGKDWEHIGGNLEEVFRHISIYLLRCEILGGGLDENTCFPNEAHAS